MRLSQAMKRSAPKLSEMIADIVKDYTHTVCEECEHCSYRLDRSLRCDASGCSGWETDECSLSKKMHKQLAEARNSVILNQLRGNTRHH